MGIPAGVEQRSLRQKRNNLYYEDLLLVARGRDLTGLFLYYKIHQDVHIEYYIFKKEEVCKRQNIRYSPSKRRFSAAGLVTLGWQLL